MQDRNFIERTPQLSNSSNDRIYKPGNSLSSSSWNKPRTAVSHNTEPAPQTPTPFSDRDSALSAIHQAMVNRIAAEGGVPVPDKLNPTEEANEPTAESSSSESANGSPMLVTLVATIMVILVVVISSMLLIGGRPGGDPVKAAAAESKLVLSSFIDALETRINLDDVNLVASKPDAIYAGGIKFDHRKVEISDIPATFNPAALHEEMLFKLKKELPDSTITVIENPDALSTITANNQDTFTDITLTLSETDGSYLLVMETLLPVEFPDE